MTRVTVPIAISGLKMAMSVPAAVLLDVSERLPEKVEPPVVVIAPPLVKEKL